MPVADPPLQYFHLHIISDSTGETVTTIAKAALVKFSGVRAIEHTYPMVRTPRQIRRVIEEIKSAPGPIFFALINTELTKDLIAAAQELGLPCHSVLASSFDVLASYVAEKKLQLPQSKPKQVAGPYFDITNGHITLANPNDIDDEGNHAKRIRDLHPALMQMVKDASLAFGVRNISQGVLLDYISAYAGTIDKDSSQLAFGEIYLAGVRLQNCYDATVEQINKGELPALDVRQQESIKSIIFAHELLMEASADGRELNEQARHLEAEAMEPEFSGEVRELINRLKSADGIADADALTTAARAAEAIEQSTATQKGRGVGYNTIKNITIVLGTGGVAYYTLLAIAASGSIPLGVAAGLLAIGVMEGTKKSKPFQSISNPIKNGLDWASEVDAEKLIAAAEKNRKKIAEFVLENEQVLRKIAGKRKDMKWLHQYLDWMKNAKD